MDRDNKKDWVLAYTAQGDGEAAVILSLLESEGIETKSIRESIGKLYAITIDGLGAVKIFVPEDSLEKAKDVINSQEE